MEHYAHLTLALGILLWLRPFDKMRSGELIIWALIVNSCDIIDYYVLPPITSPTGIVPQILPRSWPFIHRSFTHTLWFSLLLGVIAWIKLRDSHALTSIILTNILSHLIPDILTAPCPILTPLIEPLYFRTPAVSHIGLIIGLVLIKIKISTTTEYKR